MNTTHPDILEAERNGLPETKPEITTCPNCERRVLVEAQMTCIQCKAVICPRCFHISKTFMEAFCTEQITEFTSVETRNIPTDCEVKWLETKLTDAEETIRSLR